MIDIPAFLLARTNSDDPRVLQELMESQIKQFKYNGLAVALCIIVLCTLIPEALYTTQTLIWLGAQLSFVPVAALTVRKIVTTPIQQRNYKKIHAQFLMIVGFSGLMWGLMPATFFFIDQQLTVPIMIVGFSIIIGAGMALMFLPGGFSIYGTFALLIQASFTAILKPELFLVAVMGYLYWLMAVIASLRMSTALSTASFLRFQNQDILEVAEQANIAKSTFLAAASHDLRQPLHALNLLLSAMSVRKKYEKNIVDSMQKSVSNLEMLFNSLLDISKLDAGAINSQIYTVDLADIYASIANDFNGCAKEKNIQFVVQHERCGISTDPLLLKRIISNLLSNAIRYTPEDGKIELSFIQLPENGIKISVQDSGIGIPQHAQVNIFTEFTQLHNPERDREKGLGLGLAIVKRLCDLLDYSIDLTSQEGSGTRFCITLPNSLSALPPHIDNLDKPTIPEYDTPIVSNGVILVIDDELDVRDAMYELLTSWGYSALLADSQESALELLIEGEFTPDIILSDYRLREDKTGIEAVRALCQHANKAVPALLITGDTHPERIAETNTSHYTVLHKPVKPEELKQHIASLLNEL